jgi:hypothetical protein
MRVLRRLAELSDVVLLNFGVHYDAESHEGKLQYERTVRAPPCLTSAQSSGRLAFSPQRA